jgi:hypothetical protein
MVSGHHDSCAITAGQRGKLAQQRVVVSNKMREDEEEPERVRPKQQKCEGEGQQDDSCFGTFKAQNFQLDGCRDAEGPQALRECQ